MTPSEIILFIAKVSFEYDELGNSNMQNGHQFEWVFKE